MTLSWTLAFRFRRSSEHGFLSFMSFSATAGIAVGCFVLIMLLSVMNGFERELKNKLLAIIAHGEITSATSNGIAGWQDMQQRIANDARTHSVHPFAQVTGLIQNKKTLKPVSLYGFDFQQTTLPALTRVINPDVLTRLTGVENGAIVGAKLLSDLGVEEGQTVTLLVPQMGSDNRLKAPQRLKMTIVGTFSFGGEITQKIGFMNLAKAADIIGLKTGAQGLRVMLHDPFDAEDVIREYAYHATQPLYLNNWTRTHGHIFQDIQLVRLVAYIVLSLVIAVASFNIVSSMVISVKAKQKAIAILMSMGAEPGLIKRTFLYQGLISGLFGTLIGTTLAVILAPNLSALVAAIEQLFNTSLLSSDVYFVDFLPIQLQMSDVVVTVLLSMVLSLAAAWYPATRAVRVRPASVLN